MELILQEVSQDARDPDPRADPRRLPPLAADAALPRAPARAGARHALAHLLQVRGRQPGREPQAEHGRGAGLLRQAGRARARISTETGAGQWGSAARARVQALRARVQGLHGQGLLRAEAVPALDDGDLGRERRRRAPREDTQSGRPILDGDPDSPGSLGIAISEAVEDAAQREDTEYSLGSVLNHVLMHQTVIGQEAIAQMEQAGDFPDLVVGCVGGGSNFAGLSLPVPAREDRRQARSTCSRASRPRARR